MSFFDRFRRAPWTLAEVTRPWGSQSGIYEHLRRHVDPVSKRLSAAGERLPDEQVNEGAPAWAPGALDGVVGHHAGRSQERLRTKQIVNAVRALSNAPTAQNLAHLSRLATDPLLPIIDDVVTAIASSSLDAGRVHAIGRVLAVEAPARENVKLGIVLMGCAPGFDDLEVLEVLAAHEELTLFCAVAIGRQRRDAERVWWELAKRVDGWGRIQLVERLAGTDDRDIQAWMLRAGFRNAVMNEYLAYTCATSGHLTEALRRDDVDEALLIGAADILSALAAGGPAQDLGDYEDAEESIGYWLDHLERRSLTILQLQTLDLLASRDELSERTRSRIDALRNSEAATRVILQGLESSDETTFIPSELAAKARGLDTFQHTALRLQNAVEHPSYYLSRLMHDVDERRLGEVLALALQRIDLATIATGPACELGLGRRFEQHMMLDFVLQSLGKFVGQGTDFIVAGLQSPVVRNRNNALRAVAAWGPRSWPDEVRRVLETARDREPDEALQGRMTSVLRGEPLNDS